jgi:hypothetical protein
MVTISYLLSNRIFVTINSLGDFMKKFLPFLMLLSAMGHAATFSFKTDFNRSTTDNVNSSNTTLVKDTYSTLGFTLQAKTEDLQYKYKLKFKTEKYQETTANNNNTISGGITYKPSKIREYTLDAYKQTYTTTPTLVSDVTSDNTGIKLGATLSHEFSKDKTGYTAFSGNFKKYTNIPGRQDSIFDLTLGYENYINSNFLVVPELLAEYNKSTDSYYANFNLGPSLSTSFNATDELEFFVNLLLTYTSYSGRTFTETKNNRTLTVKEHQSLFSSEIGAIYTFFDKIPVTAKYSTTRNSSNNSASAYKSKVFSFNIGLRF